MAITVIFERPVGEFNRPKNHPDDFPTDPTGNKAISSRQLDEI